MLKSLKQNLSLPRLSKKCPDTDKLDVKNDKYYIRPKLKRICYPPISNPNKTKNMIVMVDSQIEKKNYEELQEEAKEKAVFRFLNYDIPEISADEKPSRSLIGKEAPILFYGHYKNLDRILQKNKIENNKTSTFTSILERSQSLDVLPCCLGLIKARGQSSVLNINNYKLGDKYIAAMSAGLKDAKLIESCLVSKNRMTSRGAAELLKNISNDISTIDLSHNKIRNVDQKLLNLIIQNESRLERLSFENNLLGDSSIQALCRTSAYSKHLKVLNIRKNMLTNESAQPIADLIAKTHSLEEIYIGMNRIYSEGANKIIESLTNNNTIKIMDYSLNKLGQGRSCLAGPISQLFRKNKTLIHLDLSSNYFSQEESTIIAEGLATNRKIYGIHYRGNYGYVDSKGFLIMKEKEDTTLHSILDLQINSYEINFRRQPMGFEPEVYKNVCWICEGWYEQEFRFAIPAECEDEKKLVYIHFDFEMYEPRLISMNENNVKYRAMIPPKRYRYFFTCDRKQFLDNGVDTMSYDFPLTYTYEMYHENSEFNVQKTSMRTGKSKKIVNAWDELQVTVLPRNVGLVTKREKIPWTYKDSLWAKEWKLEDEDMTKKCFEKDWKCSRLSGLVKNPAEQDKVKEVLYKNYKIIKEIYRHYSSWSPFGQSDVWAVSNNAFTEFCHEGKIVSKETPLKIIDLTFITTNSMSGADWKGNSMVPERGLVRFQFMESLVRLSEEKYKKLGLCETIFESVSNILKEHIQPIAKDFATEKWRLERYFIQQNDILIKRFRPIFTQTYKKNSRAKVRPGEKPFMCLAEFKGVMERAGVAGSLVIERDINLSFNCSMMTQVDELESERFMKMGEIQFIEAIARIAYLLPNTCKVEADLPSPLEFYQKFEWLINEMKNNLCSDDLKNQFPTGEKSIFSEIDEDQ